MNHKVIHVLFALTLAVAGCTTGGQQATNNAQSEAQTQVSQKSAVKRVVALTPLAADLIHTLDKTKLVGVSGGRYIEASGKFKNLPRVGERATVNLERIVALKPDLVIGSNVFQGNLLEQLERSNIPTMTVTTSSWQDLEIVTQQIAEKIGADPQPILQQYRAFLNNPPQHNKTVLVLAGIQPALSPNANSWAGDLLTRFGYKNLVADLPSSGQFQGYLTVSPEKILEMNPDQIFVIEGGSVQNSPDEIKSLPFWKNLKAAKNDQVFVFHHDGLIAPTSIRTVEEVTQKLRQTAGQ